MTSQYQQLAEWLKTPLGQAVLTAERECIKPFWEHIRGEHLLILGNFSQASLAEASTIKERTVLFPDVNIKFIGESSFVYAEHESLPIFPDSVDAILLPHTLGFGADSRQILREVETALRPDGHVIIVGFNPFSFWGLRGLFSLRKKAPWSGSFLTAARVKDWLKVLSFEVIHHEQILYRPPIAQNKIFSKLKFLEKFCHNFLPVFGGVYVLVAKKKVFGITPLRPKWKKISRVMHKGMAEPATRVVHHEQNS
jgi:SAM-dependent methyltransferase